MTWIHVNDRLPKEGKYVLARHNLETWHDDDDQKNVNCVVVKLEKGISKQEREQMPECKRKRTIRGCDEHGNNKKPYRWKTFGSTDFFGQEIEYWMEIPKLKP